MKNTLEELLKNLILSEVGMHKNYNWGQLYQCLERLYEDVIQECAAEIKRAKSDTW
jgi:hypothetical protein